MKPHPRIRKFFKWGGVVVSVLLLTVWVGSAFISVSYTNSSQQTWSVNWGCVWHAPYELELPANFLGLRWDGGPPYAIRWLSGPESPMPDSVRWIPFWPIVAFSIGATTVAWRHDISAWKKRRHARTRERQGRCPACGYDRTGLAANAPCPECNAKA